eukprot:NODE_1719_length_1629_cov_99.005312_g1639_i0.p1 GENE.NODE_1719_length_1629_cov_99.005312_g1639_i0~~NODE_1719_length_1629_cov_99.005312_g1639_i0.p1  ORF type:complete len:461 (+),score=45.90 NODE_1719_length_1629_cov_99.005312_g1639_i0:32-1384(+)
MANFLYVLLAWCASVHCVNLDLTNIELVMRLDTNASGVWPDDSGHGRHGTAFGNAAILQYTDSAHTGVSFPGDDAAIDLGNWNITGTTITMAAWVRMSAGKTGVVVGKNSQYTSHVSPWYVFLLQATNVYKAHCRLLTVAATGTSTDYNNGWHHMACTYDGATMRIYTDAGVETLSIYESGTVTLIETDAHVRIGGMGIADPSTSAYDEWMMGQIDDVLIWSRCLSAAEISSLYTNAVTYGGLYGDPHFRAPFGGVYTINGQANTVYSIISARRYQWNMMFIRRRLGKQGGTYGGPSGFRIGNHTVVGYPNSSIVVIDGHDAHNNRQHTSARSLGGLGSYVRLMRTHFIVKSPCFKVILTRARKNTFAMIHKSKLKEQLYSHFDFKIEPVLHLLRSDDCFAHGLFGQSFRFKLPVHPTGDNGENVIEGYVTDYVEPTLLSTTSIFNLFNQ